MDKSDYKFFIEEGETGFSPERNKAIIDKSIKQYEAMRKRRQKEFRDQIGERSDAIATYLTSRFAQGISPIEKYFGRKWMAYLQGRKIMKTIKRGKKKWYLPGN